MTGSVSCRITRKRGGKSTIQFKTTQSLKVIYKGRSCYDATLKVIIQHSDGTEEDLQTLDEKGCAPELPNGVKDKIYSIDIVPWVDRIKAGDIFVLEVRSSVLG